MLRDVASLLAHAAAAPEGIVANLRALSGLVEGTLNRPVSAPFNRPIGAQRRITWLTMEREQIEGIRRSLEGSLNDVVLAVVTGAVRRYLERRKVGLRTSTFRVMTPVSVRTKDQNGALGNRVSAWIVDLPVDEPDPREQLRQIHLATRELKESKEPIGAAVLTAISEWSYSALLISFTARHVTKLLPCNLVVTNIPGPQSSVYLLGAPLREAFPLVPLTDGLGLNIGLLSYDGKLCWGFSADYDIVPDLDVFVRETEQAAAELSRLCASAGRTSPSRRRRSPNLPRQSSRAPD
jgi:WS/DGAT/MGAT family acyltransferase